MKNKKFNIWLPFIISLAMIGGIFLGYKMRETIPNKSFFFLEKRKPVEQIIDLVNSKYVDSLNTQDLADTAIMAILSKLDPHSVYIPASKVEGVNDEIIGSFYGIGIEFNIYDDTLNVVNVLAGGPAAKAGLITGDKILKAGDSLLASKNKSFEDVRKILKGNRGTLIKLLVLRKNKQFSVNVERDQIPVSSIDAAYLIQPTIGYIRINKFSTQTYREFMPVLDSLNKKGMKKLILDLRDNGGGVMDEAIEIADEFLSGDKLITYTEGTHSPKKEYRCRRLGQFETGKLVILTNEGTASASEILAGALQDWDRATIVGRRTFGKGLVQEQFNLSDNSALRLTVARYFTPLGRSIQRSYADGKKAYYNEIDSRFDLSDSTIKEGSIGRKFKTPEGKILYGQDGISPDIIVGFDTSHMGLKVYEVFSKGLIKDFSYKYSITNKQELDNYRSPLLFNKNFIINDEAWKYFENMALADSIEVKYLKPQEKKFIERSLKLSIARQKFLNEGYFEVINETDEVIIKALSLLQ
ncbi:MAG: S41 family peptidase [Ferruginibacter sp.]